MYFLLGNSFHIIMLITNFLTPLKELYLFALYNLYFPLIVD